MLVLKRMSFSTDLVCVMNTLEVPSECVHIDFHFRDGVLCSIEEERTGLSVGMCVDCVSRGHPPHPGTHTFFPLESKSRAVYIVSGTLVISILTIRIRKGAA